MAGDGHYLTDSGGTRLLDATAGGLACSILGHGRKEIVAAVAEQLDVMEYNCLFGYAHPRAGTGRGVAARTPISTRLLLQLRFGGGLKIARAYWHRLGQGSKTGFVSRMAAITA